LKTQKINIKVHLRNRLEPTGTYKHQLS